MIIEGPCVSFDKSIAVLIFLCSPEPTEEQKDISRFYACIHQHTLSRIDLSEGRLPVWDSSRPHIFPDIRINMTMVINEFRVQLVQKVRIRKAVVMKISISGTIVGWNWHRKQRTIRHNRTGRAAVGRIKSFSGQNDFHGKPPLLQTGNQHYRSPWKPFHYTA